MGFFKNTIGEIITRIDKTFSSNMEEGKKSRRLAELELQAKMALAAQRQDLSLQSSYKDKIPSVSSKRVHTIVDSKRSKRLNKFSFSQQEQYEILDRRAKAAEEFKEAWGARKVKKSYI